MREKWLSGRDRFGMVMTEYFISHNLKSCPVKEGREQGQQEVVAGN